jgi:hypothetical protein
MFHIVNNHAAGIVIANEFAVSAVKFDADVVFLTTNVM